MRQISQVGNSAQANCSGFFFNQCFKISEFEIFQPVLGIFIPNLGNSLQTESGLIDTSTAKLIFRQYFHHIQPLFK